VAVGVVAKEEAKGVVASCRVAIAVVVRGGWVVKRRVEMVAADVL
jgi:hypothetical protein